MSSSTPPGITGMHHISLTVTDIDASLDWYQRLLGAQRIPASFPHYEREDSGYAVLLIDQRSGLAIGLHANTANVGEQFDEARTGLDHISFNVAGRSDLQTWASWLDELDIEHTGIRDEKDPFPFSTLVFRDPDNIQLELFAVG
ncbi:MAG TPA: VOC family protein [Mycobacterium sp.]